MNDDPPFLNVGTEVSAKYKGAFCEAKVHKVVKIIKCRVQFKFGLGSAVVSDECIKGLLRVGAAVEAKHPEKNQFLEAVVNKIQDCSQYTVVFDDGDITTLRRTALCLKSGRHFAESETLDQLPLTHPEHFGTPVGGSRRGRRSQLFDGESDDDDLDTSSKDGSQSGEREADVGKVVCVEMGERKKAKDNWFPGLVVAPTAQDQVPIRVKEEYLVRSFKDGRYYTVPKSEATEFSSDCYSKIENAQLKQAVENTITFLENDHLPPHWDRKILFGVELEAENTETSDDSDSEDDSPETKDHFVAQLYKHMDDRGTPINKEPMIGTRDLDLYRLFKVVHKLGGFNRVTNQNAWRNVVAKMVLGGNLNAISSQIKQAYKKYLLSFEDFYRKLGVTLLNSPKSNKAGRNRPGRSLIRGLPKKLLPDKTPDSAEILAEQKAEAGPSEVLRTEETPKIIVAEAKETKTPKNESEEKKRPKSAKKVAKTPKSEPEPRKRTRSLSDRCIPKSVGGKKTPKTAESAPKQSEDAGASPKLKKVKSDSRIAPKTSETEKPKVLESPKVEEPKIPPRRSSPVKILPKRSESDDENDDTPRKRRLLQRSSSANALDLAEKKKKPRRKALVPDSDTSTPEVSDQPRKKLRRSDPPPEETGAPPTEEEAAAAAEQRMRRPKSKMDGQKKDDSDGEAETELPKHVDVQFGDKLRVFYGTTQGTVYEAKVTDIKVENDVETYHVHYTGWNTRYDEWVPRQRIAKNLSWVPNRKRIPIPQIRSDSGSRRGRSSLAGRSPQPGSRSGTPSSITSTTSNQSAMDKQKKAEFMKLADERKDETTSAASDSSDDDSNLSASESDSRAGTPLIDEPRTNDFDLRKIHADLKLTPKLVRTEPPFHLETSPSKPVDQKPGLSQSPAEPTPKAQNARPVLTRASPRRSTVRKKLLEDPPPPTPQNPTISKNDSEDIYEFCEPEPFKLEIRTKRLSSPIYDERKTASSGGEPEIGGTPESQPKAKLAVERLKNTSPKVEVKQGPVEFKHEPYQLFRPGLLPIPRPEPQKEAKHAVLRVDYLNKDLRPSSSDVKPAADVKPVFRPFAPNPSDIKPQSSPHLSAFSAVRPDLRDVKPYPVDPVVRIEQYVYPAREAIPREQAVPVLMKTETPAPAPKPVIAHRSVAPICPIKSEESSIVSSASLYRPFEVKPTTQPEPIRINPVCEALPKPVPSTLKQEQVRVEQKVNVPVQVPEHRNPEPERKLNASPVPPVERKPQVSPVLTMEKKPRASPVPVVERKPDVGIVSEIVRNPVVKSEKVSSVKPESLMDIPLVTSLLPVIKLEVEVEKVVNIVKPEIKEEVPEPEVPEPTSAPPDDEPATSATTTRAETPVMKKEPTVSLPPEPILNSESTPPPVKTEPSPTPDSGEPPKKKQRKRPHRKPVRSSEYIEFSNSDSDSDDSSVKLTIDIREDSAQPDSKPEAPQIPEFFAAAALLCEETIPGSPAAGPSHEESVSSQREPPKLFLSLPSTSHEDTPTPVKKSGPKLRPVLVEERPKPSPKSDDRLKPIPKLALGEERPKQGPKFRARPVLVEHFVAGLGPGLGQNTPPTSPDTSASTLSSPKSSPKSDSGDAVALEFSSRHEDTDPLSSNRLREELARRPASQRRSYASPACSSQKKFSRSGSLGPGRSPRRTGFSEDTPEVPESRVSRYNFVVDLASELDSSQRINILQEKMKQIRKVYADLKAEVANIDRRRKKIKKKDKASNV